MADAEREPAEPHPRPVCPPPPSTFGGGCRSRIWRRFHRRGAEFHLGRTMWVVRPRKERQHTAGRGVPTHGRDRDSDRRTAIQTGGPWADAQSHADQGSARLCIQCNEGPGHGRRCGVQADALGRCLGLTKEFFHHGGVLLATLVHADRKVEPQPHSASEIGVCNGACSRGNRPRFGFGRAARLASAASVVVRIRGKRAMAGRSSAGSDGVGERAFAASYARGGPFQTCPHLRQ